MWQPKEKDDENEERIPIWSGDTPLAVEFDGEWINPKRIGYDDQERTIYTSLKFPERYFTVVSNEGGKNFFVEVLDCNTESIKKNIEKLTVIPTDMTIAGYNIFQVAEKPGRLFALVENESGRKIREVHPITQELITDEVGSQEVLLLFKREA
jgi:hypothetical protein